MGRKGEKKGRPTPTCCWQPPACARRRPAAGEQAPVPTAITIFGGEQVPFPKPPRELAERYFNVTTSAEHDRGGHFPAAAEPQLLADTLRNAFRPLRTPAPS